MVIYLITSDGHVDSLNLTHFATNAEEVKQLVAEFYREMLMQEVRNISVCLESGVATLEVRFGDDDPWEKETHRFIKVSQYSPKENKCQTKNALCSTHC